MSTWDKVAMVAVKQPKFRLDPNTTLDLGDPSARKHLHAIYLEIAALTHPELSRDPNIVRLISWSFDSDTFHAPISLVMELARGNLQEVLSLDSHGVEPLDRLFFCHDMASGLDALHRSGFIHGDIKPGNILVFFQNQNLIAKLADFGLSNEEVSSHGSERRLGGTEGWQAPEVEKGFYLNASELIKADNYSLGLVIWSMLDNDGSAPPCLTMEQINPAVNTSIQPYKATIGSDDCSLLENGILSLLQYEASQRPAYVAGLFPFERNLDIFESDDEGSDQISSNDDQSSTNSNHNVTSPIQIDDESSMPLFLFEDYGISIELIMALQSFFKASDKALTSTLLFRMFLSCSSDMPRTYREPLSYLLAAASQGSCSARAVVPRVLEFYDQDPLAHIEGQLTNWLIDGASTGSILARNTLFEKDFQAHRCAIQEFQSKGGYNMFYSDVDPMEIGDNNRPDASSRYSRLHWLAAYGSLLNLKEFFNLNPSHDLNEMSSEGETPLYLACVRGSWDVASELLARGASASNRCTPFGITCLHWVFNFESEFQVEAVAKLTENGADINAAAHHLLPFPHYPFHLPTGTALHWAVSLSSHSAIEALVKHGADLYIRDGCDPYKFDKRMRSLDSVGGPNMRPFSSPKASTQGLSALDYAAIECDPFIFKILFSLQREVDVNTVDEEGLSVLHRLSAQHFQTTRTEQEWSRLPFQGSLTRQSINVRQTVAAIKRLGGNIDLLTRPQPGSRHRNTSHTPLMMAGLGARPEVVEALLNEGANPDVENNFGETALFCLSQERDEDTRTVQLLCLAGANANHKDHEGIGASINAGLFHLVEVVDMLLAYGADMERYHQRPESPYIGGNVFALLSSLPGRLTNQDLEEQYEPSVAKLLTKYVCSNTDAYVRQQVINGVDNYDRTLLWHYSENRMQHCVASLIANGADVNTAGLQFRHRRLPSRELVIDVWRETPLDAALRSKSSLINDMERDRHLPISEFNNHCRIYDIIIAALRDAGGVSAGKQIKTFPETIDNLAEEMPGWVESMKRCGNI
ncbi:hypothetical protein F4679DRAFT_593438 [Xylaria curta]|nr:hypothetical protein F4679DRAFT_593438 [Xylaria curta]